MNKQQEQNDEEERDNEQTPEDSYRIEPEEGENEEGGENSLKKDRLRQEIERLRKEKDEYLEGWQRERASFANFRKDEERRIAERQDSTARNILLSLISLSDIFDILIESASPEIRKSSWFEGLMLTKKRLSGILSDYGAQEFSTKEGDMFDPNFHEALESQQSDKPSGTILHVAHKGYMAGKKALRAAGVIVAK